MPLTKRKSMKNKQNHILSKEDTQSIVSLLDNGLTLQEAMEILMDTNNAQVFQSIQSRLKHGENITDFFYQYSPKEYRSYFSGFMKYMPFIETLSTSIEIVKNEEKNKKQIFQGMFYPSMLLIGMIIGIFLFNEMILPNMITLMAGFSMESTSFLLIQKVIRMISMIMMITIIIIIITISISLMKRNIVKTYRFISIVLPNTILVQYASNQFAQFFLECQKRNISTKKTLEVLSSIQENPIVSYISKSIDESLMEGETLETAIDRTHVEKALLRFFRVAIYASDCEGMLKGYLDMVQIRKENAIKKYSRNVQLFSYSLIGVMLIFVYRILMMPMSMLQNI